MEQYCNLQSDMHSGAKRKTQCSCYGVGDSVLVHSRINNTELAEENIMPSSDVDKGLGSTKPYQISGRYYRHSRLFGFTRQLWITMILLLFLSATSSVVSGLEQNNQMGEDIQNILTALEGSEGGFQQSPQIIPQTDSSVAEDDPLSGLSKSSWGIPDVSAIIGKVFTYEIPKTLFKAKVDKFKVCISVRLLVSLERGLYSVCPGTAQICTCNKFPLWGSSYCEEGFISLIELIILSKL